MFRKRQLWIVCLVFFPWISGLASGYDSSGRKQNPRDMAVIVNYPEHPVEIPNYRSFWFTIGRFLDFNHDNIANVGHTGIILVNGSSGELHYFDFGRYDDRDDLHGPRPEFYGTVRSERHVPQLKMNIRATIIDGWISNLDTVLVHLAIKKILSGYDPIDAAVVPDLDLEKMLAEARYHEDRGYIYYGAPAHLYCTKYVRKIIRAGGGSFGALTMTGKQTVREVRRRYPQVLTNDD
jgi:hypothetical protein